MGAEACRRNRDGPLEEVAYECRRVERCVDPKRAPLLPTGARLIPNQHHAVVE